MFLVSKIPHAPPKLITEFLRKINKVGEGRVGEGEGRGRGV